jgi:large subunit ribosomal protein L19
MNIMETVEKKHMKKDIDVFEVGDTVSVHVLIREGEKERIQVFKGTVIARRGSGLNETFTVRKISFGLGVERIFPVHSSIIKKVKFEKKGQIRRAKLYYLRELKGKAARLKEVRPR